MGIVVSLIFIAVGAILTWAVTDTSSAIDIATVGVILMVLGIVGLLLDLLLWSPLGPGYMRRRTVAAGPPVEYERRAAAEPPARPARRTVVEEEEVVADTPAPGPPPP